MHRGNTAYLIPALLVTAMACDPGPSLPPCVVGADCASGVCRADGVCAPQQTDGAAVDVDAGLGSVDGGTRDSGVRPDAAGAGCRPNADGVVTRAEVAFGPDLGARYRTAANVGVSTAGSDLGDGRRRWDFAAPLPGDHDVDLTTEALTGRWFADLYPGADYVTRLSSENDLLGVFRVTSTALELLGVVSPTDGFTRTELTYAPAVRVLVFPLEEGLTWTSDTRITGLAQGLAANYREVYESRVDARGEVVTPYAPFESLRVRTTLTRDVGLLRTVVRQMVWVTECFGSVATVVSEDDESEVEFDRAAEIRRLGF